MPNFRAQNLKPGEVGKFFDTVLAKRAGEAQESVSRALIFSKRASHATRGARSEPSALTSKPLVRRLWDLQKGKWWAERKSEAEAAAASKAAAVRRRRCLAWVSRAGGGWVCIVGLARGRRRHRRTSDSSVSPATKHLLHLGQQRSYQPQ